MAKYTFYGNPLVETLKNYSKDKVEDLRVELEDTVNNIEAKAIERAPVNEWLGSALRNLIHKEKIDQNTWAVKSDHYLSAYWEFGTGVKVFKGEDWIDEDMRIYAANFYKTGEGTLGPHPYLFNSYAEEIFLLQERIKEIL